MVEAAREEDGGLSFTYIVKSEKNQFQNTVLIKRDSTHTNIPVPYTVYPPYPYRYPYTPIPLYPNTPIPQYPNTPYNTLCPLHYLLSDAHRLLFLYRTPSTFSFFTGPRLFTGHPPPSFSLLAPHCLPGTPSQRCSPGDISRGIGRGINKGVGICVSGRRLGLK